MKVTKQMLQAFGRVVRECRKDCGLTQQELAERLGMKSHAHISRIERGEVHIHALLAFDIAKELGVTLTSLLNRADRYLEK